MGKHFNCAKSKYQLLHMAITVSHMCVYYLLYIHIFTMSSVHLYIHIYIKRHGLFRKGLNIRLSKAFMEIYIEGEKERSG